MHGRHDVGEQPGPPLATAPHDDAVAAGGLHHAHRVVAQPDVPVAEHRQDGQWINASPWTRESSGRSDTNWPVVLHDAQ